MSTVESVGATVSHSLRVAFRARLWAPTPLEAAVGAYCVFWVAFFPRQPLIELFDALVGEGVIQGDGHLAGHLGEEAQIVAQEAVGLPRADIQGAESGAA